MPRTIYTAENNAITFTQTLRAMVRGMVQSRYLGYRLAVRSVKARYAKSALGIFWDLIDPLVLGLIFYALMIVRVIQPGEMAMPYAVFIIYGLLLYATFSDAVMQTVDVLGNFRSLITQQKFPPEALLIAVFLGTGFALIFRLVVMLAFSLALQHYAADRGLSAFSALGALKFVLLSPLVILVGMSIGLVLAPFNAIYSDVGRFTRIVLNPLRYLSPVLWPLPHTGAFGVMLWLNPLSPLIGDLRHLAVANSMVTPGPFFAWLAISSVLFLGGWFVFHLAVPVLAERA